MNGIIENIAFRNRLLPFCFSQYFSLVIYLKEWAYMLYALIVYSFLLLSNIPLYGCAKVCLTIHPPFKDLWLIYSLGGGVIKYCGYLCALFVWVSFHVWYITNKHGERCPTSLVISKMQTKNKVRDQYPLLRTGKIREWWEVLARDGEKLSAGRTVRQQDSPPGTGRLSGSHNSPAYPMTLPLYYWAFGSYFKSSTMGQGDDSVGKGPCHQAR